MAKIDGFRSNDILNELKWPEQAVPEVIRKFAGRWRGIFFDLPFVIFWSLGIIYSVS